MSIISTYRCGRRCEWSQVSHSVGKMNCCQYLCGSVSWHRFKPAAEQWPLCLSISYKHFQHSLRDFDRFLNHNIKVNHLVVINDITKCQIAILWTKENIAIIIIMISILIIYIIVIIIINIIYHCYCYYYYYYYYYYHYNYHYNSFHDHEMSKRLLSTIKWQFGIWLHTTVTVKIPWRFLSW